jgi:hypothetical protein
LFVALEVYAPFDARMEREIATHIYVLTRVELGAALANDDIACLRELATEQFYAETLTFTVPPVIRTTYAFLVCHGIVFFLIVMKKTKSAWRD